MNGSPACTPPLDVHKPRSKNGFTLIEISIVLVIVGLVVGGVVAGREMVLLSEMRAQVSQIEQVRLSVTTFALKYGCLPGDCRTSSQFFAASVQPERVTNGDGDGRIRAAESGTPYAYEINMIWQSSGEFLNAADHLAAAGLINLAQYDESDATLRRTPGIGFPLMAFVSKGPGHVGYPSSTTGAIPSADSAGGVVFGYEPPISVSDVAESGWYPSGQHVIRLGARGANIGGVGAGMSFARGLNPWDALTIDAKLDDGFPYSGRIVAGAFNTVTRIPGFLGNYGYGTECAAWASKVYRTEGTLYQDSGAPIYRACHLVIKAGF